MLSIPSACLSSFAVLLDEYVGINGVVGLVFMVARWVGARKCFHTTGTGRVIVYPWLA